MENAPSTCRQRARRSVVVFLLTATRFAFTNGSASNRKGSLSGYVDQQHKHADQPSFESLQYEMVTDDMTIDNSNHQEMIDGSWLFDQGALIGENARARNDGFYRVLNVVERRHFGLRRSHCYFDQEHSIKTLISLRAGSQPNNSDEEPYSTSSKVNPLLDRLALTSMLLLELSQMTQPFSPRNVLAPRAKHGPENIYGPELATPPTVSCSALYGDGPSANMRNDAKNSLPLKELFPGFSYFLGTRYMTLQEHQKLERPETEVVDDDDDDDDGGGDSAMLSYLAVPRTPNRYRVDVMVAHHENSKAGLRTSLGLRGGGSSAGSEAMEKLFVTALVTLIFEACLGHILEFFKIIMQTADEQASYVKVFRDVTREKGLLGLWDGFLPWGVIQAVFKGSVFGFAHSTASSILTPLAKKGYLPMKLALTLAGGIGGGFQGYVLSPTLLLKTRVMTDPVFREQMSLLRTCWLSFLIGADVIRKEGLPTLMKGANVFAAKRVFDWASRYYFSDVFESLFQALKGGASLSLAEKGAASFLGGVASTCVTLPLDVLVAKMQDAKKAGVNVSALDLFLSDLRERGFKGVSDAYLRGFAARLAHVCLTTVVVKTGTPLAYEALFGKPS